MIPNIVGHLQASPLPPVPAQYTLSNVFRHSRGQLTMRPDIMMVGLATDELRRAKKSRVMKKPTKIKNCPGTRSAHKQTTNKEDHSYRARSQVKMTCASPHCLTAPRKDRQVCLHHLHGRSGGPNLPAERLVVKATGFRLLSVISPAACRLLLARQCGPAVQPGSYVWASCAWCHGEAASSKSA